MELSFQTSPIHYLRCIMQEIHFQEESADTIVPDSYPDIAAILDCHANVILRGKDCRDGSITIAGGIKGGILYIPENEASPRCLDLYIPFSMKYEHPLLTPQAQVVCTLRVRSVDSRIINSRKASLRVGIGCDLYAYLPEEEVLYSMTAENENLQIKEETYQVELPLEMSEKSFSIQETIDFSGNPSVVQICKVCCTPVISDRKLVANKAVFKGLLYWKTQYLTSDGSIHVVQQQIPYSQYCELSKDYDEDRVVISPMVTGCDLELDPTGTGNQATLTVHLLAQCLVEGSRYLGFITDAYAIKGNLEPQWKTYSLNGYLDHHSSTQTFRKQVFISISNHLDTDLYWDFPVIKQIEDKRKIVVPVTIRTLGENASGELIQKTDRAEIEQTFSLSEECQCLCHTEPSGDVFAAWLGDSVEIRSSASITYKCLSNEPFQTLCGGQIEQDPEKKNNRISAIVKVVPESTSLWDLAKQYRTTEEKIRSANHLNEAYVPENTMVLLPLG